ncbi:MAG: hypothetical protein F4X03_10720 [Dehalococcoidia bacterium]|nr:hypothetical protein [Dehalococcoidia bacterium]MYD29361.1 hypothetical protein [Dehalococcoidia bacterium]
MTTQTSIEQFEAEQVSVDELRLDALNPRIQRAGERLSQDEILEILWREYSVDEVAWSIARNRYFPHEALFASGEDGALVVIEGNRRLAAVRLLREPDLRKKMKATDLPEISPEEVAALDTLPVTRRRREDVWQYVGFKHVNGPQAWGSFAKAEYIAWVRNDIGKDLADIAETIGDRHRTVARLYRAYMAIQQARAAGAYDVDEQRSRKRFAFSHLYTGLDYRGIQEFTGVADLDPPTERPIPSRKMKHFGELCVWLWGDKTRNVKPEIKTQNPHLRQLDEALQSKGGLSALRAGLGLSVAYDIHRGDTALFREGLVEARQALQKARGKVLTGFAGEADQLEEIGQIVTLSETLHDDMQDIVTKRRRKSRRSPRRK